MKILIVRLAPKHRVWSTTIFHLILESVECVLGPRWKLSKYDLGVGPIFIHNNFV